MVSYVGISGPVDNALDTDVKNGDNIIRDKNMGV
jgi:hypothetical protein